MFLQIPALKGFVGCSMLCANIVRANNTLSISASNKFKVVVL